MEQQDESILKEDTTIEDYLLLINCVNTYIDKMKEWGVWDNAKAAEELLKKL